MHRQNMRTQRWLVRATSSISFSATSCSPTRAGYGLPWGTAVLEDDYFRNDARFGGWQNYLQRKDDFYRFCCCLHISAMLTARDGVDETRVAFRWLHGR